MEVSEKAAKRYYDPELISLLLNAISALGAIAAILGTTINVIQYRNSVKEDEAISEKRLRQRYSIRDEVRYTLHSLALSVDNIDYELRTLENIYCASQKVSDNSTMQFGNGSMWLERFQFERFCRTQTRIVDEARNIYSNLKLIEELLCSGEDDSLDLGYNVRVRHMLIEETAPVNHLISKFGEISVDEFLSESIRICQHTRSIIKHLEDNLRRNYM